MQPRSYISPEEYLALEAVAETKHEYWDGHLVAMASPSLEHNLIKDNLAAELKQRLRERGCRVVTSDQRVQLGVRYVYPDVVVVCGEPELSDSRPPSLVNPDLLVEICSDVTNDRDYLDKLVAYMGLDSLHEYWIVDSGRAFVTQFIRRGEEWIVHAFLGAEATLDSDHFGIKIPLNDIYALAL